MQKMETPFGALKLKPYVLCFEGKNTYVSIFMILLHAKKD